MKDKANGLIICWFAIKTVCNIKNINVFNWISVKKWIMKSTQQLEMSIPVHPPLPPDLKTSTYPAKCYVKYHIN